MTPCYNVSLRPLRVLLLLAALLLPGWAGLSAQEGRADLTVSELSHDFGSFARRQTPGHTFVITNRTDRPVVITAVRTNCNCTRVKFTRVPIQPGATGSVEVTYRPADTGAFYKEIQVQTTAPGGPLRLVVKGNVTP